MPPSNTPAAGGAAADDSINLPLFDISKDTPETGKAIIEAAAKWGFLWIVSSPLTSMSNGTNGDGTTGVNGHGDAKEGYDFNEKTVDEMFGLSKKFFTEAPQEEKEAVAIKQNRGWIGMHVENLDPSKHKRGDFKQAFNIGESRNGEWQQPMPTTLLAKSGQLEDFWARCESMSRRIFRLMGLGLEIEDAAWLESKHQRPSAASIRLLYYPSLSQDSDYNNDVDIRAGAHSDYGSITLLFQRPGQPGLEILRPDGTWASVPIFPPGYHSTTFPPVLVNIGDMLSYWTNGLLKSTVHRVIFPTTRDPAANERRDTSARIGEDRYSIACFVDARAETKLTAIPSPLVKARAEHFAAEGETAAGYGGGVKRFSDMKTLTAGEYLRGRLQATYGTTYSG